jgi:elongation factor P
MISTNDMRPGMSLDLDGELFTILEYAHHKPGKGHAMVRTKLKNLRTGALVDKTFRADEKVEQARLDKREKQYLYSDGDGRVFMDKESFEQITLPEDFIGGLADFLKEGDTAQVVLYEGEPIGIEMAVTVDLKVAQTDPGLQGDRSSAGNKPATLETGATIQVPLFINEGDVVRVDTRTSDYVTRVR